MDFESRLEELDGVSVSRKHFRKFGARGDKTGAPSTLLCHNEDSSFKHYPPSRIADHPESHKRLTAIIDRLKATDLFSRCAIEDGAATVGNFDVECLAATIEAPYLDLLKNVENLSDEELEHEAGKMDSVYFQKESFKAALAVLNLIFEATDAVWDGLYSNAIVIARPPGHHALVGEGNGFCLLNNVAHGAEHALSLGAQRVLIVDFDVHHGQGIQRRFEDSGNVTYFSVHRYEGGRYWPHLHESNFTFVGTNEGAGHTVNVPLSKTGANDVDYMAIFWNVLYPLALTVDPDFVIISAGFDACAGDPLGEMNVTPDLYAHWIYHLKAFANGKVVTVLEGGYNHFNQSVAVQRCVEALLGNSVAPIKAISGPSDSISKDILNTLDVQKWYWPALNDGDVAIFSNELKTQEIRHQASVQHLHTDPEKTIHKEFEDQERLFSSRKRPKHPVESESLRLRFVNEREDTGNIVQANLPRFPIENFTPTLSKRDVKVGLAFSRATCGHRATLATHENPERVAKTFDHLQAAGLLEKCSLLEGSAASDKDLQLVHSKEHIEFVSKLHDDSGLLSEDLYANESTEAAARHSVGCVLKCVEEVLSGNLASAFALTRPPGHHAETNKAQGFCFFNNVAVAAKYAQKNFDMKRVLILDWDIHFGNGTAEIFAKDDSVLYVSLHRFAESFYPHTQKGSQDYVGDGEGAGYTVNVPWLSEGRNDNDYLLAFSKVVMPIAYEFDPELVLVSCGFDACQGENVHLGDCYLTPLGYSRMIHLLGSLANGRVIAVLEGGYNIDNIRFCTEAVLSTMVANQAVEEEPVIPYRKKTFTEETLRTIQSVIDVHGAHWKFLRPFMASPE